MVVFMEVLEKTIEKIKSQSLRDALAVQSSVLKSVSKFGELVGRQPKQTV